MLMWLLNLGFAASAIATSLEVSVAASADDAREVVSTGTTAINGTTIAVSSAAYIGFRFVVPTLPQGATLTADTWSIQFTAGATNTGVNSTNVFCEDADAAAQYTAGVGNTDISERAVGDAIVWAIPDWTSEDRGAAQLTPDLSTIIQPVVNRAGFDGVLNFILLGNGTNARQMVAQDHATLQEATLVGEWTVAPAASALRARVSLLQRLRLQCLSWRA